VKRYVTDTHPLIWALSNDPQLSTAAQVAFAEADAGQAIIIIPPIVAIEMIYLSERGRIPLPLCRYLANQDKPTLAQLSVGRPECTRDNSSAKYSTSPYPRDARSNHSSNSQSPWCGPHYPQRRYYCLRCGPSYLVAPHSSGFDVFSSMRSSKTLWATKRDSCRLNLLEYCERSSTVYCELRSNISTAFAATLIAFSSLI
jgi:PIN domain nuclease of toxin-antitoxin system